MPHQCVACPTAIGSSGRPYRHSLISKSGSRPAISWLSTSAGDRSGAVAEGVARADEQSRHHLVDHRRLVGGERQDAGPGARDRDVAEDREVDREALGDLGQAGQRRIRVELARVVGRAAQEDLAGRALDEERQEDQAVAILARAS